MNISAVMIVDDSESDHYLIQLVLEEYDEKIEILQAYDGEEALQMLDTMERQPDVIFLDITMPGMNGFEFLESYSKREGQASAIGMLSSSDREGDRVRAIQYECVKAYFTKPVEITDLEFIEKLI